MVRREATCDANGPGARVATMFWSPLARDDGAIAGSSSREIDADRRAAEQRAAEKKAALREKERNERAWRALRQDGRPVTPTAARSKSRATKPRAAEQPVAAAAAAAAAPLLLTLEPADPTPRPASAGRRRGSRARTSSPRRKGSPARRAERREARREATVKATALSSAGRQKMTGEELVEHEDAAVLAALRAVVSLARDDAMVPMRLAARPCTREWCRPRLG